MSDRRASERNGLTFNPKRWMCGDSGYVTLQKWIANPHDQPKFVPRICRLSWIRMNHDWGCPMVKLCWLFSLVLSGLISLSIMCSTWISFFFLVCIKRYLSSFSIWSRKPKILTREACGQQAQLTGARAQEVCTHQWSRSSAANQWHPDQWHGGFPCWKKHCRC